MAGIMDNHTRGASSESNTSSDDASPEANASGGGQQAAASGGASASQNGEPGGKGQRLEEPQATGDVLDDALAGEVEGEETSRHDPFHAAMDELEGADEGEEAEAQSPEVPQEEPESDPEPQEDPEAEPEAEDDDTAEEDAEDGNEEEDFDPVAQQRERLAEKGIELEEGQDPVDFIEQEVEANQQLLDAYEKDPQLLELTKLVTQEGLTTEQALATMELDVDPDDPEVIKQRARQEAREEHLSEQVEAAAEQGQRMRESFQEEHGYDDEELGSFLQEVNRYVNGDPANGGHLPQDFLDVMHRGLRYEKDVEAAREKGETEGRNQQIRDRREKKRNRGDGLPKGQDGSTGGKETQDPDGAGALAQELGAANGGVLEGF